MATYSDQILCDQIFHHWRIFPSPLCRVHLTGWTGWEKVTTVQNHFKAEKMKGKGYIRAQTSTQNKITSGKRLFLVLSFERVIIAK